MQPDPTGPMTVYCPHCGAYLFALSKLGEMACDQCGGEFEILPREPAPSVGASDDWPPVEN